MSTATDHKQGIREHLGQFSLHVLLVFATGLTIGSERTVVPALGEDVLGVESFLVIGSFVVSFGIVKSILNLYAGKWGEEYGRKPVLIAGWATALPLPVILIFAPSWGWITVGNILLGINQALTWSMAINAKIDLASSDQRGLAVGIDESFGYTGVAVGAWITGVIASQWSLRPEPFYFLAIVVVLAFLISIFLIKETVQYAQAEGDDDAHDANLPFNEVLKRATYGDRTLFAAAQAATSRTSWTRCSGSPSRSTYSTKGSTSQQSVPWSVSTARCTSSRSGPVASQIGSVDVRRLSPGCSWPVRACSGWYSSRGTSCGPFWPVSPGSGWRCCIRT